MTDLSVALQELLERATEAESEVKADPPSVATLTPDAFEDLAQRAAMESPAFVELQAQVEALQDELYALANSTPDALAVEADEEDEEDGLLGMDYDEPDDEATLVEGVAGEFDPTLLPEGKADGWAACPDCGSAGADEYDDGTARCEDCGTSLTRMEAKAHDFDDTDDELDGVLAVIDTETKTDVVLLSELELLQARREALEQ